MIGKILSTLDDGASASLILLPLGIGYLANLSNWINAWAPTEPWMPEIIFRTIGIFVPPIGAAVGVVDLTIWYFS